ncbi:MAG TPA: hypothetical protein VF516_42695 [Kofleriaceae bacterium]
MIRAPGTVIGFAAIAAAATGCMGDIDPPWQLSHDRIVAVRADPPGITAGQTSRIDALLAHKGQMTSVATPELAAVTSPMSLSDVLSIRGGTWTVTAPGEDRLAAARGELMLPAGAPVPLQIGVSYGGQTLIATKTITLGQPAANPTLDGLMIDGKPPGDPLTVGKLVNVPLSINASDADFDVTWLTSCGTMHDFDLPQAYLRVETADPQIGELGVVLRDAQGGVAWKTWPIHAE